MRSPRRTVATRGVVVEAVPGGGVVEADVGGPVK